MPLWNRYHLPRSVDEALALLAVHEGRARIIAGGTDLMIDLQYGEGERRHTPEALVDVTRIPDLGRIEARDGLALVGAAVTHTAITQSALLEAGATCLVESCGVVGGPQVRNVGTLGGNVAHALPAGDGSTSLVALDAEAEIAWGDGRHAWQPIRSLFAGPGVSALDSRRDVLAAFRFRLAGPGEGSAFKRVMRPQGVALPILGCAVWVKLDEARAHYADVRICIGPVAPTPVRAAGVEAALRGLPIGPEAVEAAVQAARETLHPRASKYRATAGYRVYMVETLLRQALPRAAERARTGIAHAEGVGLG